jgi:hypothetical protein
LLKQRYFSRSELLQFLSVNKIELYFARIFECERGRSTGKQAPERTTPGRDDNQPVTNFHFDIFSRRDFYKMSRFLDDLILHVTPDKFYVESLSEQQVGRLMVI